MSADSFEELNCRLDDLIFEITQIKSDSYACSRFDELKPLVEKAIEELEKLL